MASQTQSLGHGQAQRSQLEFGNAMSNFTSMFPSIDYDVIEMVLRANNGLVDATIDQLLSMQSEPNKSENTLVDPDLNVRLPGYNDASSVATNEPPPAYTPRIEDDPHFSYDATFLGTQLGNINTSSSSYGTPDSCIKSNAWNPPLLGTLPNDFLRLNVHNYGSEVHQLPSRSPHVGEMNSSGSRNEQVRGKVLASRGTIGTPVTRVENTSAGAVTTGFDAIPDSESSDTPTKSSSSGSRKNSESRDAPTKSSSSGSRKNKSKRFGQMSRKFRRKKSKSAKNNYEPMSAEVLVDEDDENEKEDDRR